MAKALHSASLLLLVILFFAHSAAAAPATTTAIRWADVPPAVQETINRYKGDGAVDEINKAAKSDGRTFYDVIIRLPESHYLTLEVRSGGKLTSFKYRHSSLRKGIYLSSMSKDAQKTVAELTEGAKIRRITEEFGDGNALYEVRATTPDHHLITVKVMGDGRLLEMETTKDPYWTPHHGDAAR